MVRSAYLLTSTALQPTWGKIYQIFNVKSVFTFVMIIFMVGSLLSGFAPNSSIFIIGRSVAGLGCGGVFAGGLTIIVYSVPLHRRPLFIGGLGAVTGVFLYIRLVTR